MSTREMSARTRRAKKMHDAHLRSMGLGEYTPSGNGSYISPGEEQNKDDDFQVIQYLKSGSGQTLIKYLHALRLSEGKNKEFRAIEKITALWSSQSTVSKNPQGNLVREVEGPWCF